MPPTALEIKARLDKAVDLEGNVLNMDVVLEVVSCLERLVMTSEALESTRIGLTINTMRKKTQNKELAKRAKKLVEKWRAQVLSHSQVKMAIKKNETTLTNGNVQGASKKTERPHSEDPTKKSRKRKQQAGSSPMNVSSPKPITNVKPNNVAAPKPIRARVLSPKVSSPKTIGVEQAKKSVKQSALSSGVRPSEKLKNSLVARVSSPKLAQVASVPESNSCPDLRGYKGGRVSSPLPGRVASLKARQPTQVPANKTLPERTASPLVQQNNAVPKRQCVSLNDFISKEPKSSTTLDNNKTTIKNKHISLKPGQSRTTLNTQTHNTDKKNGHTTKINSLPKVDETSKTNGHKNDTVATDNIQVLLKPVDEPVSLELPDEPFLPPVFEDIVPEQLSVAHKDLPEDIVDTQTESDGVNGTFDGGGGWRDWTNTVHRRDGELIILPYVNLE